METQVIQESAKQSSTVMDRNIEESSTALKAISHPIRLKILCVLDNHELSVQEIINHVGTSQSNVSKHLSLLRDKGILTARKDTNRMMYRIANQRILMLVDMMHKVFCSPINRRQPNGR